MSKQADREDNKRMDEMEIKKLQGVIEAILFTMGESVELERIAAAIEHGNDHHAEGSTKRYPGWL